MCPGGNDNINQDSIGRLSSIVNNSDSANYLNSISYNPAGQTTAWTLGSNIAESLGYDSNRLQMTSQTVTQSGSTRLSLSYSYAASSGQMGGGSTAGNAGQLMSVSGSIGGQTESAAYTYDNVGRLVTSNQTSNGVSAQRRFVYDRWGNRTEVYDATSGGSQIQAVSLDQSGGIPTNRITSVTAGSTLNYTYDAAGNVTNDGVHSYTYDAENRVVSVDSGSTATYSYDHQNRRVKKTVGSTTTHYVWEGSKVIAEHNGSTGAVITEYIFAGSRMIAREDGSGRVYFLNDRLSARATITDGGSGSIQGRQTHLPFGEELVATGTTDKHRFTSYERDSETGTDYAVNRQYSQNVGRFMRVDPYEKSSKLGDPQSFNRYSYVQNDPINASDPLGLFIQCDLVHSSTHTSLEEVLGGDPISVTTTTNIYHCYENGISISLIPVGGTGEDPLTVAFNNCMEDAKTKLREKAKDYFGPRFSAYKLFKRFFLGNISSFLGGGLVGTLAELLVGGTSISIIISAFSLALIAAGITMLVSDALEIDKWLDVYKDDVKKCDEEYTRALRERGPVFRRG